MLQHARRNLDLGNPEYANLRIRIGKIAKTSYILEKTARIAMYTKAIARKPGPNFASGITTANLGVPDFEKALAQHQGYCQALESLGVEVIQLEADEQYPDGCFVEDTAIVTEQMAIITNPGNPLRSGEQDEMASVLSAYRSLYTIHSPGHVDGGDILKVGNHFYIGISDRTNREGAKQLRDILERFGYTSSEVPVSSVLHLKTGVTHLRDHFILISDFAGYFPASKAIRLDADEAYCANCLFVNDHILMPKGYPRVKSKLLDLGHTVIEIEMSEFRKMDGGLTCLSLLF
jgi:dimethylargininase